MPDPTTPDSDHTTSGSAMTHLDEVIRALAGPEAIARDDQRAAVAALVDDGRRVLVVQATGWGKSAVYWAATAAIRARGGGPTLVVSPLLALMRDQILAAARAGLRAETINSTNVDDWDDVINRLNADALDVLLVSPERLANPQFAARLRRLTQRCGLLVIDEAHCISDWGFDFRPDYQRLSSVLLRLTDRTPVLATTATANARVTHDVAAQLGHETLVLRGTLARASLRLAVTPRLGALDRYAWVADALDHLAGSGIVYALTKAETERVAAFLQSQGFDAVAYNGDLSAPEREAIEQRLAVNDVKAVVATSALGMGYDKPDLAFVVHLGSPASPVGYYQQVGRAGRALDSALAILLPSADDERIWEYFAQASIPDPDAATAVLHHLDTVGPSSLPSLETATGVRRGRLESLLKILAVDGAVEKRHEGWTSTDTGWTFDVEKYGALLQVREHEADLMRRYAAGAGCLMAFLQEALDDPDPKPCGRCSVCTGALPEPGTQPTQSRAIAARAFLRGRDVVLEPRKLWPAGLAGRKGKIAPIIEEGRALAYADDPAWADELGAFGRGDAPLSDDLADGVRRLVERWQTTWTTPPMAVVPMPSRSRRRRILSLAEHVATHLGIEIVDALTISGPRPPQDVASAARAGALLGGLSVAATPLSLPESGALLLVDDTYRTGWTMTVAATTLASARAGTGAISIRPLVLHRLP